ncbi:ras association domain-containing protein 10 [Phycodurus eques]|uniref:ras association domain-containing protein 10 n=1 Tax=Phycodurus eques TaxID=693459 RepID=UPI002ACF01DE|nr:ras association domain-containing protein 10 [Phycodurus eques]
MMDSAEGRIAVWVCAEEKLVLGLSKRTTCADVVKALLEDLEDLDDPEHQRYCIAETWRGHRRILPDQTRIWRLWVAWGDERDRVKFALVGRNGGGAASPRSAEARVVLLAEATLVCKCAPAASSTEVPLDRIVSRDFRKLEESRNKPASPCRADDLQTLERLVVSQERTIRLQALRIQQLDAEIERRLAKVHLDRTRGRGLDYVQDSYLVEEEAAAEACGQQVCPLRGFLRPSDGLCQEALADKSRAQMEEEPTQRRTRRRREEERPSSSLVPGGEQMFLEERLRRLLDATSRAGLRLRSDLEAIRGDLELSRQICGSREEEMRDLLEEINSLGSDDGGRRRGSEWVRQAGGLSKWRRGNDDDSDTGLSSLHSQESDSITVCQSLV